MAVAIEPGLYLSQFGFGIRVEDNALITAEGCEILSRDIPRTVEEIEAYFARRGNA
jgi:Xaa-Pro aminopeptidase